MLAEALSFRRAQELSKSAGGAATRIAGATRRVGELGSGTPAPDSVGELADGHIDVLVADEGAVASIAHVTRPVRSFNRRGSNNHVAVAGEADRFARIQCVVPDRLAIGCLCESHHLRVVQAHWVVSVSHCRCLVFAQLGHLSVRPQAVVFDHARAPVVVVEHALAVWVAQTDVKRFFLVLDRVHVVGHERVEDETTAEADASGRR